MQPAANSSSSSAHSSTQPTLIMKKAMDLLSLLPIYPKRKRNESFDVLKLLRPTTSSKKDDMKPAVAADEDRHDQKKRIVNINKVDDAAASTVPPPDWVMAKFRNMGAADDSLRRVMTKNVTPSDADRAHNRLLLSKKIVGESRLLEGLIEDERNLVGKEEDNKDSPKPKGLQVVMVDGEGRNYEVVLKFLTSNNAYRIIGKNYVRFVADNTLTPVLDTVHLCLFRVKDDWGQLKLKLGVVKTTNDAEEKVILPTAPVHEDEEVLKRRAIREGKRPLLKDKEEEEKVWRLGDIREDKRPFSEGEEDVLKLQTIREGKRPLLEFDLNLSPSEEDSTA